MKKVSYCFVNTNDTWGGGEKWHLDMAVSLKNKNYDVKCVVHPHSELKKRLQKNLIETIDIKIGKLSFLSPFKQGEIKALLKKHRFSHLIITLPSDLKAVGIAGKNTGIENIIYARALAAPVKNSLLNRWIFKNVTSHVLVNSLETKRMMLINNPLLIQETKIYLNYYGINLEDWDSKPVKPLFVKEDNVIYIGNAGRLVEQKGQHLFIPIALNLLGKKFNAFRIVIAGTGPLEKKLKQKVIENNLEKYFVFLGFVDDIKSFMSAIDIFALTSFWEGFGYVIAEAMSCSKPICAFDITSNPELIKDGENGYLIEPENTREFAESLYKIASNPKLLLKMGREGRDIIEQKFTLEYAVKDFLNKTA